MTTTKTIEIDGERVNATITADTPEDIEIIAEALRIKLNADNRHNDNQQPDTRP